jgi:transcriptional regulator with XRE-family HTH domain
MEPSDDEFRKALRAVLARSGLSMRGLSGAMGRDAGYVAAWLDPDRPSRARPTPDDLIRASNATDIPFVELLEMLWGIDRDRLVDELRRLRADGPSPYRAVGLGVADRAILNAFADFLRAREKRRRRRRPG